MHEQSRGRYLRSFADELNAQAARVRNLIGDAHWLTDGAHKESLLRNLVRSYLPSNVAVGHGFVLADTELGGASKELDIVVVDTRVVGPIFDSGGTLMALARETLAIASVKSVLRGSTLSDTFENLQSVRAIAPPERQDRMWCGGFFYQHELSAEACCDSLVEMLRRAADEYSGGRRRQPFGPNLICTSDDLAIVIRYGVGSVERRMRTAEVRAYRCGGTASGIFLADIVAHISSSRGGDEDGLASFVNADAAYPLEECTRSIELGD